MSLKNRWTGVLSIFGLIAILLIFSGCSDFTSSPVVTISTATYTPTPTSTPTIMPTHTPPSGNVIRSHASDLNGDASWRQWMLLWILILTAMGDLLVLGLYLVFLFELLSKRHDKPSPPPAPPEEVFSKGELAIPHIEILAAAATRHGGDPREAQPLAEDVTGIHFREPYLIGYVVDGAKGPHLHLRDRHRHFTSRIHARVLGESFIEWSTQFVLEGGNIFDLSEQEFKQGFISFLEKNISQEIKPFRRNLQHDLHWQASFSGFILDLAERTLHLYQMGDTAVCVFSASGVSQTISGDKPIYTILQWNRHNESYSLEFSLNPDIRHIKNIRGFIVASDGVFDNKIHHLEALCRNYDLSDFARRVKGWAAASADDKTLMIVSLEQSTEHRRRRQQSNRVKSRKRTKLT